ncbi:MAG: hypothetical protein WBG50_23270 [Desulfomonilaceae bacterium]
MNCYEDILRLGITAIIWICWCVSHSLLNIEGVVARILAPDSRIRPYYRLIYSIISAITLGLVYWVTPRYNDLPVLRWHGVFIAVKSAIWVVALAIGYLSFRFINIWDFLGLTAVGIGRKARGTSDRLVTWGIYGEIRNPRFLAGLLLLWARDLTCTGLVTNMVLSLYLISGALIEEKRLVRKFGEEYVRYKSRVPRFIPRRLPPLRFLFGAQDR